MNTKKEKIEGFNPSGIGASNAQIFGLPFNFEESEIVLLPIPWEVTVSYKKGTAKGPEAIFKASPQLDLRDYDFPDAWKAGFFMLEISKDRQRKNNDLRPLASEMIALLEKGDSPKTNSLLEKTRQNINEECNHLLQWVREQTRILLEQGKIVGIVGGDHSVPLGLVQSLSSKQSNFGVLQIDAHADLRKAYEGFTWSHASFAYNMIQLPEVSALVQVGVRDICDEEVELIESDQRITCFYGQQIARNKMRGISWAEQVKQIVALLPDKVYITFDIDGLDPSLCPNTGTPVPGGLTFEEACFLIAEVARSGKKIIGFDLVEVSPGTDEWDANVGARVLYKLCAAAAFSNGLC